MILRPNENKDLWTPMKGNTGLFAVSVIVIKR